MTDVFSIAQVNGFYNPPCAFDNPYTPSSATNIMEYISLQTEGDAVDFGDLTLSPFYSCGLSNGHGGL